jgi:hypothetical protein
MCIASASLVSAGLIHSGRQVEAATPERYSRSKKRITAAPASATQPRSAAREIGQQAEGRVA